MQHNTNNRSLLRNRAIVALLSLGVALACLAPAGASADAPPLIRSASATVLVVTQYVGNRFVVNRDFLQPAPEPSSAGFVSQHLIDSLSGVVNNGVRLGPGSREGAFYVHFKPQGFGGVLSVRYRR